MIVSVVYFLCFVVTFTVLLIVAIKDGELDYSTFSIIICIVLLAFLWPVTWLWALGHFIMYRHSRTTRQFERRTFFRF